MSSEDVCGLSPLLNCIHHSLTSLQCRLCLSGTLKLLQEETTQAIKEKCVLEEKILKGIIDSGSNSICIESPELTWPKISFMLFILFLFYLFVFMCIRNYAPVATVMPLLVSLLFPSFLSFPVVCLVCGFVCLFLARDLSPHRLSSRMMFGVSVLCVLVVLNTQFHWIAPPSPRQLNTPTERLRLALQSTGVTAVPTLVENWTVSDVQQWLVANGFTQYKKAFFEVGMNGPMLSLMSEEYLLSEFEMNDKNERMRFMQALHHLVSEGEPFVTNFWDYRQLNRFRVAWLNVAVFTFPRSTAFYLYYHNYPEITPLLTLVEKINSYFSSSSTITTTTTSTSTTDNTSFLNSFFSLFILKPLSLLFFLLFPNLFIALAASSFGFGINFWITFAFVLSCVCNFEIELELIRTHTLPPGRLSLSLFFQRFNVRGLWSPPMIRKWKQDLLWLGWTLGSFYMTPWFITDFFFYSTFLFTLSMGVLRLINLMRAHNWVKLVASTTMMVFPCFLYDAFSAGAFLPLSLVVMCMSGAGWVLVKVATKDLVSIVVDRTRFLESSVEQTVGRRFYPSVQIRVKYKSESGGVEMGVDMGGLYRDWLVRVSRLLFDTHLGLTLETEPLDGVTYLRLNEAPTAFGLTQLQLDQYYLFMGRILGLSLRDDFPLGIHLASPLCKLLACLYRGGASGPAFSPEDMRFVQLSTYEACVNPNLPQEQRDENISQGELVFAADSRVLQEWQLQEQKHIPTSVEPEEESGLRRRGLSRPSSELDLTIPVDQRVTLETVDLYARLLCRKRLYVNVESAAQQIVQGLAEVLGSHRQNSRFTGRSSSPRKPTTEDSKNVDGSSESSISDVANSSVASEPDDATTAAWWQQRWRGGAEISVEEWRKHTSVFPPHKADCQTVQYFWNHVLSKNDAQRSDILFWITGRCRPPLNGFASIPMVISIGGSVDRLPVSHTCSSYLDLPEYASQMTLDLKMNQALEEQNFGLA